MAAASVPYQSLHLQSPPVLVAAQEVPQGARPATPKKVTFYLESNNNTSSEQSVNKYGSPIRQVPLKPKHDSCLSESGGCTSLKTPLECNGLTETLQFASSHIAMWNVLYASYTLVLIFFTLQPLLYGSPGAGTLHHHHWVASLVVDLILALTHFVLGFLVVRIYFCGHTSSQSTLRHVCKAILLFAIAMVVYKTLVKHSCDIASVHFSTWICAAHLSLVGLNLILLLFTMALDHLHSYEANASMDRQTRDSSPLSYDSYDEQSRKTSVDFACDLITKSI